MPAELPAEVLRAPAARRALAARDVAGVFRLLTEAGVSQRRLADLTGVGQSEVSEVLSGRRVQSVWVLEKIADGLGVPRGWMGLAHAPGDVATGEPGGHHPYSDGDGKEVDEDMKRRAFLAAASVAVWGRPVLGELLELPAKPETPTPLPTRLSAADVAAVEDLTGQMRVLARQYGGQADTMGAVANRSVRLLKVPAADPVRSRLGSALAELHTEAGWCCFDSGLHDQAQQHYRRAVDLAAGAGDGYQLAYALRHAGLLPAETGGLNDALKLYQLGQIRLAETVGDDTRVSILNAWLHAQNATALADMGQADKALAELARAREGWQPADAFEAANMDMVTGWVNTKLGRTDDAEPFVATSVQEWNKGDRRDGVLAEITLAQLHVQTGESDGAELARRAIAGVADLRSVRARTRLSPLITALDARPGAEARGLATHARRVAGA